MFIKSKINLLKSIIKERKELYSMININYHNKCKMIMKTFVCALIFIIIFTTDITAGYNAIIGSSDLDQETIINNKEIDEQWEADYYAGIMNVILTMPPHVIVLPPLDDSTEYNYEVRESLSDFISDYTDNVAIAWNFFISKGASPYITAAIIGNLQQESSPDILSTYSNKNDPHGGSYGIAQWNGTRLKLLKERENYDTLEVQLQFLWEEMNGLFNWDFDDRLQGKYREPGQLSYDILYDKGAYHLENGLEEWYDLECIDLATRLFDAAFTVSADKNTTNGVQRRVRFATDTYERFELEFESDI